MPLPVRQESLGKEEDDGLETKSKPDDGTLWERDSHPAEEVPGRKRVLRGRGAIPGCEA